MKNIIEFFLVQNDCSDYNWLLPEEFEAFCERFPQLSLVPPKNIAVEIELDLKDPLLGQILSYLWENHQLQIRHPLLKNTFQAERCVDASANRVLEESDFNCEYYTLWATGDLLKDFEFLDRETVGYEFKKKHLKKRAKVGHLGVCSLASNEKTKNLIEANFDGAVFKRIEAMDDPTSSVWQMMSSNEMPPLLNSMVDVLSHQTKDGNVRVIQSIDDEMIPRICEYSREQLHDKLEDFDLAMTAEILGQDRNAERRLICSARFRDWAIENRIPFDYTPITLK